MISRVELIQWCFYGSEILLIQVLSQSELEIVKDLIYLVKKKI